MHKAIIPSNHTEVTMSSQQIAELVDSRHDSVRRTIERLAGAGVIQLPPLVEVKNHLGQQVQTYLFSGVTGKRDSIVVVAQLSPTFTARLVDRWQELEAQLAKPVIPTSFAEALRLAADQQEQIQQLALTNQQQASRIDALEQLLAAGVTAPDFCRRLNGVNTMEINAYLQRAGWLFDSGNGRSRWRVASYARDKYMTEQAVEIKSGTAGAFSAVKAVLLKAGAQRLIKLYLSSKLPMKRSWDGELKHDLVGVVGVAA